MNCPKCNNQLKEGAKFCTSCGTKIAAVEAAAPAAPAATAEESAEPKSEEAVSVIKNRIIWNIQQGEIAREIGEKEFLQYTNAIGLIINEGTKAVIKMNGQVIATLSSGTYDFIDRNEFDSLVKKQNGVLNKISGFIANLFCSKANKEKSARDKADQNLVMNISKLNEGKVFSILLFLDVPFTLLYGAEPKGGDDLSNFVPMSVRTKNLDVNIGVRASFKINDALSFAKNYMYSNRFITTSTVVESTSQYVVSAVRDVLKDVEVTEGGFSSVVKQSILDKIKSLSANGLYGFEIDNLIELSSSNEDLERFRALSEELYLSEKELDYLKRTNEFKNRLTDTENTQRVNSARTNLELYKALEEVNKDGALAQDELDKFYTLLSREKAIRDAKSEDEVAAAMAEIKKTGLIREEDLAALQHELTTNNYQRGFALKMTQLKDGIIYHKAVQTADNEMAIDKVKAEIEQARLRGDFDDERYNKQVKREADAHKAALEIKRGQAELEMEMKERASKNQMDNFMQMAELKQKMQDQKHSEEMEKTRLEQEHQRGLESMEMDNRRMKYEQAQTLSAEQLMALGANDSMDAEAAREYARSFSAGKEAESLKAQADKVDQINEARFNDMKEMMREMLDHNRAVTSSLAESKERSKEEYRERLNSEQQRQERTQERALDYTTRNNIGAQPTATAKELVRCPHCNSAKNERGARFCEDCGNEL